MIPMRYASPIHCLGLTYREEGLRGLYRGYIPFFLASLIYWGVIPVVTELSMLRNSITGNFDEDQQADLIDEVKELRR